MKRNAFDIPPGTQLGGLYEVDAPLAAGGIGEVYKGHAIHTGDPVALKVIRADLAQSEPVLALFRREASALHALHHEAIVRYFVFGLDPVLERAYLAMEYVEGVPLADLVRGRPLPEREVDVLRQRLAAGLHAAHLKGVVHRDISPDNIIIPDGDVSRARIIDFGIARFLSSEKNTIIGDRFAGKYSFASPEQFGLFGGDITGSSDIYSLALVLLNALLGHPLYMGGTQAAGLAKRTKPPDLRTLESSLKPLLGAMLQPAPGDRPKTMLEVAEWRPTPPTDINEPTGGAPSRLRRLAPVALVAAAAALGVAAVLASRSGFPEWPFLGGVAERRLSAEGFASLSVPGPVRVAVAGGQGAAIAPAMAAEPPAIVVRPDETPHLVWDPASRTVASADGVIAYEIDRAGLPAVIARTAAIRDIRALGDRARQPLSITPERSLHKAGTEVEIEVPNPDARVLTVLNVAGDGTIQILYPSPSERDRRPAPSLKLPLQIREPFGSDEIVAISTPERQTALERGLDGLNNRRLPLEIARLLARDGGAALRVGAASLRSGP